MKNEILNGIANLKITTEDFEQNLEDSIFSSAYAEFNFETENFLVKLVLCETVKWESNDFYEPEDLTVEDLIVENQEGIVNCDSITDEEILNNINF